MGLSIMLESMRHVILEHLRRRSATVTELSRSIGVSKSTVYYHLCLMVQFGLVERRKIGKWVYYAITDSGKEVVEKLGNIGKLD